MIHTMREILNPGIRDARSAAFPHAPEQWDEETARDAARQEHLDPTDDHWETVRALQGYFAHHERVNMRELHDALDEKFHAKGGMKYLYGLFPGGPVAQGCRLAGLESPAGAADSSFGSVQ